MKKLRPGYTRRLVDKPLCILSIRTVDFLVYFRHEMLMY